MTSIPNSNRYSRLAPKLHNGDHMKRKEFHVVYGQMPEGYKAELIGGIVFEPSPLGYSHGKHHIKLGSLFERYCEATPGAEVADNVSVFLSEEDEVQPDLILRTVGECGGQSHLTDDDYVEGVPELVAEIANSSRAIDLHLKKQRYSAAGVLEYIVVCLRPKAFFWFDLPGKRQLIAEDDVFRSKVFPGLWLHGSGLLGLDDRLILSAFHCGLQSREHKKFVAQLKRRNQ